jgi:hypothetical protein
MLSPSASELLRTLPEGQVLPKNISVVDTAGQGFQKLTVPALPSHAREDLNPAEEDDPQWQMLHAVKLTKLPAR